MHTFLRAIGLSNITSRIKLDRLLGEVMARPDKKSQIKVNDSEDFTEIGKSFGDGFGIIVRGIYDEKGFFHVDNYFPYLTGVCETIKNELTISRKSDEREFAVMCDDVRLGVLLIFYLQNSFDYIRFMNKNQGMPPLNSAYISGLSVEGKIILPVVKDDLPGEHSESKREHNKMVYEARNGDEEAIEKLAVEDIDMYVEINKRIKDEDIYSIVDTSFFPFGSESDNYAIVGTILNFKMVLNEFSGEFVCVMLLECNDLIFNICINQEDLYGMPMVGARFKGNVWLQGRVEF